MLDICQNLTQMDRELPLKYYNAITIFCLKRLDLYTLPWNSNILIGQWICMYCYTLQSNFLQWTMLMIYFDLLQQIQCVHTVNDPAYK